MLLLSRIVPVIVLAVVVQCVYGYQRIVHINEHLSDDEDFYSSRSKKDLIIEVDSINLLCCVYENCSCYSFDHALAYLTSNVLVNITTDVTLTSVIHVSNLVNVSIIGHNNPTVNCRGAGGIHFTSCHNCIIQGITLDGCGTDNDDPGLKLTNSSDITIQKCSFQHSRGQAVALSEISGNVKINNCKFVNNIQYKGHGAIINISFSSAINSQLSFKIHVCDFSYNKGAKSLIYINNKISEHNINLTISSSEFHHNQGVSVHIINQKLYLTGRILFQQNTAEDGVGIHISDHSTVVFGENSNVTFLKNTADKNGGAILSSNYSIVLFNKNSKVMFTSNKAKFGTAVHSNSNSNVIFKDSCKVIFYGNSARRKGTAVFSTHSNISFEDSAYTEFSNNVLKIKNPRGGTIYAKYTHLSFGGNSMTKFSNNTAYYGGAIDVDSGSYLSFKDNSTTKFSNNKAYIGGAIDASSGSQVSFQDNSTTKFSNNSANFGGAIHTYTNVSLKDNSTTEFSNNRADYGGGAICAIKNCHISFKDNSTTKFRNNSAADYGGAIYTLSDRNVVYVSFEDNSTIEFINNRGVYRGGAIFAVRSHISFEDSSTTKFSNNKGFLGGAIHSQFGHLFFEDSSTTTFSNNNALSDNNAILTRTFGYIIFNDNSIVSFISNKETIGGIVYPISTLANAKIIARGNFTITFNHQSVKWCTETCLKYSGRDLYDVRIDNTGNVWCRHRTRFTCQSRNCHCKNF